MFTLRIGFVFVLLKLCSSDGSLIVNTTLGAIKGHYRTSPANLRYEAYEGIPFAEPPVGDKRFRPPTPIKPWQDILSADGMKKNCLGVVPGGLSLLVNSETAEDCLYFNVYVPEKRTRQPLPVIVFIYGGGFQFSALKGDEQNHFMDKGVIFVTFNHRHGLFGFLSTEDETVSGNMGLKDQVLVLKWIKEHIESFGGDPNRITLAGISAGGASVHYHYLSPMSAGLFHSGISLSGTALVPWAQAEQSRKKAIKLAELVKCNTTDIRQMIQCLREKPARSLLEAQKKFADWVRFDFTLFGPVVEKDAKDAFIDRPPIEILKSGNMQNLPWITGVVSEEGLTPVAGFCTNETFLKKVDENWEKIAPELLQYYYSVPETEHSAIARRVREYYFGQERINKENIHKLIHLVGDRLFITDAIKSAKLQAKMSKNPVWFYYFTYRPVISFSEEISGSKENFGTSHADDMMLITRELGTSKKEENDFLMQKKLIDFWVSVAYNGRPAFEPKWQKVISHNQSFEYLKISGPENLEMVSNNKLANNQFWDSINFHENTFNQK